LSTCENVWHCGNNKSLVHRDIEEVSLDFSFKEDG